MSSLGGDTLIVDCDPVPEPCADLDVVLSPFEQADAKARSVSAIGVLMRADFYA